VDENHVNPSLPVFNKDEFLLKWDEENPVVVIPPQVAHEIDKDWYLTDEEEQYWIQQYLNSNGNSA
jgi:hypothetical protein